MGIWSDIQKRSSGELIRKEEFDVDIDDEVKKHDLKMFAEYIVFYGGDNSISGFKEFVEVNKYLGYYCKVIDMETHKTWKDVVIPFMEKCWKSQNYDKVVNKFIYEINRNLSKLGFTKEPGKLICDTLEDFWNNLNVDDKYDLLLSCGYDDDYEFEQYSDDELWDDMLNIDKVKAYVDYMKKNESIWSDIQKRNSGEEIRKEDEIPQDLQKPLAIYIEMFASIAFNGEYTVGSYPDFRAFVKDFMNNQRIMALDFDMGDLLDYITQDHYYDIIHPVIIDTIDKINKSVDIAVDSIIDHLKNQDVNESVWSDIQKRSSGETIRKEDDVLSDMEINSLNTFISMYCRRERGRYIEKHIAPPPPAHRHENDYEGLIKYILDRWDENLFTDVGDYDKIIRYIEKNWDKLDMDKYIKKYIFSPHMMKGKKIVECEGVPGGTTPANVGGMGAAYFPGPNGEPGSGDLPSPTGIIYHQVAPYTTFLKQSKKKKKKNKKFRKEDEPCVHSENPPIYSHVDDFRDYVDRTYKNIRK